MPEKAPDLFEIMATTRSMRRLKPDPVPAELIRKILEAGVCAPSGGNMQRWRFLVVREPMVKQTVGSYYKRLGRGGQPTIPSGRTGARNEPRAVHADARCGPISGRPYP